MTAKDYRRLRTTEVPEWLRAKEKADKEACLYEAVQKPKVQWQAIAWALDS
jgi:hypothetical protein